MNLKIDLEYYFIPKIFKYYKKYYKIILMLELTQ